MNLGGVYCFQWTSTALKSPIPHRSRGIKIQRKDKTREYHSAHGFIRNQFCGEDLSISFQKNQNKININI